MDVQGIHEKVRQMRLESFDKSDQLSLGGLIDLIKALVPKQKEIKDRYGNEARIVFDFCDYHCSCIDSWRGAYDELAIDHTVSGEAMLLSDFLRMLCDAVDSTFAGYKGGDFMMEEDTPVWVDNYGKCTSTAIIGILDNEHEIILVTGKRDL